MILKPKKSIGGPKALLYRRYIGLEKSESLNIVYLTVEDRKYWTFDNLTLKFNEIESEKVPQDAQITRVEFFYTVLKYKENYFKYNGIEWVMSQSADVMEISNSFSTPSIYLLPNEKNHKYIVNTYNPKIRASDKPYEISFSFSKATINTVKIYARNLTGGDEYILNQVNNYIVSQSIDFSILRSWLYVNENCIITKIEYDITNTYIDNSNNARIHFSFDKNALIKSDITLLSATFNNIGKYQTNKYYFVGSFDYMQSGDIEETTTQHIKGNIIPLTSFNIKHYNDDIKLREDDLVVVDGLLYSVERPGVSHKHFPKHFYIYYATLNSIL